MTPNLASRLQDLPGVASVVVDLDDSEKPGINVRLEPGSDEADVLERVRALLIAYGVRGDKTPILQVGRRRYAAADDSLGVDVRITPVKGGARVEVMRTSVRSFRVVPASPKAIAQGISDAWCQVVARVPVEIAEVSLGDRGDLSVTAREGTRTSVGTANVENGWSNGIALAVGRAIGTVKAPRGAGLTESGW